MIFLNAGTRDGFVFSVALIFKSKTGGDYHNQLNSKAFEKWFEHQLLPSILSSSTIGMDNASYDSRKIDNPPTSCKKSAITKWLEKKGVGTRRSL